MIPHESWLDGIEFQRRSRWPTSARVLGVCGLVAAILSTASGFLAAPSLLGISGAVMVGANLYAMVKA